MVKVFDTISSNRKQTLIVSVEDGAAELTLSSCFEPIIATEGRRLYIDYEAVDSNSVPIRTTVFAEHSEQSPVSKDAERSWPSEESIAALIGGAYWEHGIGKSDEWCMKLSRKIINCFREAEK